MNRRSDLRRLAEALTLVLFLIAVIRTAWLSDDAFITFRTIDNFVSGHGLRWNLAERVQTYTHPLWMFLVALPYSFTREPFFTPYAVSILCSAAAVWILVSRLATSTWTALVAGSVIVFSKAFVDYSTSGLENPLTHLLLALFVLALVKERSLTTLWFVASLIMLNRIDAGLLVLPALLARTFTFARSPRAATPSRDVLRVDDHPRREPGTLAASFGATVISALVGLTPLIAWEIFSLVYYGFLVPNTGYAKLNLGVGMGTLVPQGFLYLLDSLAADPVTLFATLGLTLAALLVRPRHAWPLALGIVLYLAYVVRIGGDFMSGRFLAAPLFLALANFARLDWTLPAALVPSASIVPVAIVAALGLFATTRPPLRSGYNTVILTPSEGLGVGEVADERSFYYRYTGLLRWSRQQRLPYNAEVQWGREAAAAPDPVVVHPNVGLFGFFAGPRVHIVDPYALCDPLLARLPPLPGWRIGHFERAVPVGYTESIRTGQNQMADTAIAMKYEQVKLVTQGPIWSRRRWRAILTLNLGG